MLRKLSLVAVAAASLGLAALAPTSASAWGGHGWHGGWHGGWHRRLGLGRSPLLRRRSGLLRVRLWLWRLLCAATGSDAVGPALAPGKPLLLTSIVRSGRQKGPGRQRPGLFVQFRSMEPRVAFVYFYRKERNPSAAGNHFRCSDLFLRHHVEMNAKRKLSWIANKSIASTSRSICDAVGERLQQDLRPEATPPSPYLQHLLEELRRRDGESQRRPSH